MKKYMDKYGREIKPGSPLYYLSDGIVQSCNFVISKNDDLVFQDFNGDFVSLSETDLNNMSITASAQDRYYKLFLSNGATLSIIENEATPIKETIGYEILYGNKKYLKVYRGNNIMAIVPKKKIEYIQYENEHTIEVKEVNANED